jgi:hemerythrin-like domain-containing protein
LHAYAAFFLEAVVKPALPIIEAEHRTLGTLLKGLKMQTDDLVAGRPPSDPQLLHTIIRYIAAYPERYHHPKETRHLFSRLRMRTDEFDGVLDRLDREHLLGESLLHALSGALDAAEAGGEAEVRAFSQIVYRFVEFYWQHMRLEEDVVLPAARRLFTEDDWDDLDCAFSGHVDPLVTIAGRYGDEDFTTLIRRLKGLE